MPSALAPKASKTDGTSRPFLVIINFMDSDIKTFAHRHVKEILPYQLGRSTGELAQELGLEVGQIVRLAANENPRGMSPRVRKVIEDFTRDSSRYPEVSVLQNGIAKYHNLDPEQVIPGNGSCEILELVARTFLSPGRASVYPLHSFVMYKLATQYMGATGIAVPPKPDFSDDLIALRNAITPETRVLWISNINNPTGSFTPYPELKQFIASIPPRVIVVLDEAYYDYLDDADKQNSVDWLELFPNLIITRTFSKVYGLAGIRAGYGLTSAHLGDLLNRMRGPYNCNSLAIAAALAALQDREFVTETRAHNFKGRHQLVDGLDQLGYKTLPSWGNFVTAEVGDALEVATSLRQKGVIVLPLHGYQMPKHIRVSVGLESENARFLEAMSNLHKPIH